MIRFFLMSAMGFLGFGVYRQAEKTYGPFQLYGPPTQSSIEAAALSRAKEDLTMHEGRRNDVYYDTQGYLTVGIGHKVTSQDNLRAGQKISDAQIEDFFEQDVQKAFAAAKGQANELGKYDADLIAALTGVNFQLGTGWRSKFKNTWEDLKKGNAASAINRLRQSEWMKQTPIRVAAFIDALGEAFG